MVGLYFYLVGNCPWWGVVLEPKLICGLISSKFRLFILIWMFAAFLQVHAPPTPRCFVSWLSFRRRRRPSLLSKRNSTQSRASWPSWKDPLTSKRKLCICYIFTKIKHCHVNRLLVISWGFWNTVVPLWIKYETLCKGIITLIMTTSVKFIMWRAPAFKIIAYCMAYLAITTLLQDLLKCPSEFPFYGQYINSIQIMG